MGDVFSAIGGTLDEGNGDGRGAASKRDPVVDEWTPRHDLVALLKAIGHRNYEIAEKLDYDPAYVSRILADPRAKLRISELATQVADNAIDVGAKLKLLANEAVDVAANAMRMDVEAHGATVVKAAFGILDRAGYSKIEKSIQANIDVPFDRIEEMTQLARDANRVTEEFDYGREIEPAGDPSSSEGTES